MEQIRALNALAPFIALAKSATSPRAAADLITQATTAPNTYVFAELLHHPNIQALASDEKHSAHLELLKIFAYGTWESYNATPNLPKLSDAQQTKLRLLTLLTIASTKDPNNLTYAHLSTHLSLPTAIDLEHLVTQAIYADLLIATLNPASQTVVITSVAPLRDLAPGSVGDMIAELSAWSGRCESVLVELEAEVAKVKLAARRRNLREGRTEKQVKAVNEEGTGKSSSVGGGSGAGGGNVLGDVRGGRNLRYSGSGGRKLGGGGGDEEEADDDDDAMELDGGNTSIGGRKKSGGGGGGGMGGLMGKFGVGSGGGAGGRTGR